MDQKKPHILHPDRNMPLSNQEKTGDSQNENLKVGGGGIIPKSLFSSTNLLPEPIGKSRSTLGGRVFASLWILSGTVYVAQLLFTFALLNTERRQRSLVKWVLKRQTTASDLEAADFDGDGIVVAAEFVIYKLKEMGKISQDDITPIMDEFETLDFDKTGTLSASDILRGQSSLVDGGVLATQMSV
ncbi:two-pore potassium channel 1-like protein [Tanacetum coccineum]